MAPVGRLVVLALLFTGLGTVTLATAEPAAAAPVNAPTAIAVARGGATYVGFATGGRLLRIGPKGVRSTVPLDQDDPVDGLFVNSSGQIWVDYGTSVSLLGPAGRVLRHFDHSPVRSCAGSPAARYGGITVGGGRVWVANRCDDSMTVYTPGGRRIATVDLPGRGHPRGIAYGGAQAGRGAIVYVALPDSGRVVAYGADRVRHWRTVALRRPGRGARPRPAGLAVDRHGQLTVSDLANNAIYLLDTNHGFHLYRTLGHPSRASRAAGRLNGPSAIAQHTQDGGSFSGNLFIADTFNQRVQRWNTSGWTYWVKKVRAGHGAGGGGDSDDEDDEDDEDTDDGGGDTGDGSVDEPAEEGTDDPGTDPGDAPRNLTAPSIVGTAAVGQIVTCSPGTWTASAGPFGGTIRYTYGWTRGGLPISGAAASTYLVVAADAGATLTCVVTAANNAGSTAKSSAGVVVTGSSAVAGPVSVTPPAISGTPAVGSTLTCSTGTWTGTGLTHAFRWQRNGTAIAAATASTYAVVAADAGTSLTCVVTATNGGGSVDATSTAVAVSAIGGGGPVNTAPPTVTGAGAVGTALTCTPGSWTGGVVRYAYSWSRDGVAIEHTAAAKYVVLNADVGTSLGCTVTAVNADGAVPAGSAARAIAGPSGHAPLNLTPPTVTGSPELGHTLTCDPGTWSGDPTAVPLWQRDGLTVANGGWTYLVGVPDAGAALQCLVVAENGFGLGAARSAPAAADSCTGPTGVEINGGAAETTSTFVELTLRAPPGTTTVHLSNDPTFAGETVAPFPGDCSYDWVMPSIPGLPLSWTVYVRYDSSATVYTDSIVVNQPS